MFPEDRRQREGGGKEQHLVTVHSKSCLLLVGVLQLLLGETGVADKVLHPCV